MAVLIKLTPNEFKLLQLLAARPGQTLTREQLLDDLHGIASSTTAAWIRISKISERKWKPHRANHDRNVYGIGYRFNEK
jgi:DNA-binding response OmpR family regulator